MSMVNRFLILDKSEENIKELKSFISMVCESKENASSAYNLRALHLKIEKYGDYTALEGELYISVILDLEYWLKKHGKESLVSDARVFIHYHNTDYVELAKMFDYNRYDKVMDVHDGYLCELHRDDDLSVEKFRKYFCTGNKRKHWGSSSCL